MSRGLTSIVTAVATLAVVTLLTTSPAAALAASDADSAFNAYNAAFLVTSGSTQYYKEALNVGTKDYFWRQALDIQMAEDVYLRSKNPAHQTLITNLLNTFLAQNAGTGGLQDWTWNQYNDDLAWAGLAFARGYQATGNTAFLNQAKNAFDLAYSRGWDATLGGGIWWNVAKTEKSALSNNPNAILACYIYEFTGDASYLTKAQDIYAWVRSHLYNTTTGAAYENLKADGTVIADANVYNQGAFIGAANHLHRLTGQDLYYDDALRTVEYVRNNKTSGGILTNGQRQGTWQSEFARGLGELVRDNNLWSTYYPWMLQNANAAWSVRRTDLNLSWNNWTATTPSDSVTTAVECVGAVIMINVTPVAPPGFTAGTSYRLTPKIATGSALDIAGAGTTNGTGADISTWSSGPHQIFRVDALGRGYYRLVPTHATGSSLDVPGAANADGTVLDIWGTNTTAAQYWKLVYDYGGYYKLKAKCAPARVMNVSGFGTANGTPVILWHEATGAGGDNERWTLLSAAAPTATATATRTPTATAASRATPTRTATPTATPSTGTATTVSLSAAFNVNAAYTDGTTFSSTGGLDGVGSAYSSTLLGTSLTWSGTPFNFGPASQPNGVRNATVTLPAGRFATLLILGAGLNGDQASQAVKVNYTDGTSSTFTQTFSNWLNASQNVAGQSVALTMAYRNKSTGVKDNRAFNLYGYSFALTSTKTVSSLVLPANNNVSILAATLRTGA
jgi:predicted alpha-1,6-mannanase (GH76 family)